MDRNVLDQFHTQYYFDGEHTWGETFWMGVRVVKCPLDLWVMQEIVHDVKPDLFIETGSYVGGSALYFASLMDMLNKGKVISIDIDAAAHRETTIIPRPVHKRIEWLQASSIEQSTYEYVKNQISVESTVLVNLDSEHTKEHVLKELNLWSNLVTPGSYLICEDTNIAGHPLGVWNSTPGGPAEAVAEWLPSHPEFQVDRSKEKHHLTFNPGGYLKRV